MSSGVPGELYYVRKGYVNEYALSFNQLLKSDVTDIYFDWFDEQTADVVLTTTTRRQQVSSYSSNIAHDIFLADHFVFHDRQHGGVGCAMEVTRTTFTSSIQRVHTYK